jgi:hypothetical protein
MFNYSLLLSFTDPFKYNQQDASLYSTLVLLSMLYMFQAVSPLAVASSKLDIPDAVCTVWAPDGWRNRLKRVEHRL